MKNILIIENDEDILELLTFVLEEEGYKITSATNHLILDHIQDPPTLIILDELLGTGVNGSEICKKYKSDPATSQIPIVLISAVNGLDIIAKACKADCFISKPFDLDKVIECVNTLIQEKEALNT